MFGLYIDLGHTRTITFAAKSTKETAEGKEEKYPTQGRVKKCIHWQAFILVTIPLANALLSKRAYSSDSIAS